MFSVRGPLDHSVTLAVLAVFAFQRAWVLFAMVLVLTLLQLKLSRIGVRYESGE
jgi:hypothetical protein